MTFNDYGLKDSELDTYRTFHLDFYIDSMNDDERLLGKSFSLSERSCTLRGSPNSREECLSGYFTLNAAIIMFDKNETLSEMLVKCATSGFPVDFIHLRVKNNVSNKWRDDTFITKKVIDTQVDDVNKYIELSEVPQFYIANVFKNDFIERCGYNLKWVIVDRFKQDLEISFIQGKYDPEAVIAAFTTRKETEKYLNNLMKK